MAKKIYLIIFSLLLIMSCKTSDLKKEINYFVKASSNIQNLSNSYPIKVKVVTKGDFIISSSSKIILKEYITNNVFYRADDFDITIKSDSQKLYINDMPCTQVLYIEEDLENPIYINDKSYLGSFKILFNGIQAEIINIVPIELYLLSVVPSEMPSYFESEALQAQAIIARTYAYYFITQNNDKKLWDVDNTVSYQVFNGFNDIIQSKTFESVYKAVNNTAGLITTFDKKPIISYFHANSGGYLTSGADYFGPFSDKPYLVEKEDPYSVNTQGYLWSFETTIKEFQEKTEIDLSNPLVSIIYNEKGVVKHISFMDNIYKPKQIRAMFAYKLIKSEKMIIDITEEKVIIHGFGFGHGVGMSQWGAQSMALQEKKHDEIISFYYPSTELTKF